jgi:hypothetical protein
MPQGTLTASWVATHMTREARIQMRCLLHLSSLSYILSTRIPHARYSASVFLPWGRGGRPILTLTLLSCVPYTAASGSLSGTTPQVPSWLASTQSTLAPPSGVSPCPPALATPMPLSEPTQSSGPPSTSGDPPPSAATSGTTGQSINRFPSSGLPPVPGPLCKRIAEGAFVDLGDLLPEALEYALTQKQTTSKTQRGSASVSQYWVLQTGPCVLPHI